MYENWPRNVHFGYEVYENRPQNVHFGYEVRETGSAGGGGVTVLSRFSAVAGAGHAQR